MKIKPPTNNSTTQALEELKRRFINGEEEVAVSAAETIGASVAYPWEEKSLREDRSVNYPLRLSEVTHAKIKYISEKTSSPMSKLLSQVIEPWVNKKILDLIKENE